jgi:CHAD domain-containing protein
MLMRPLLAPPLAQSDYRRYSDVLREAAGKLATARDAYVKVGALTDLTAHFKTELSRHSFDEVKRTLSRNCRRQQLELSRTRAPRKVNRLLKALSARIGYLKLKSSGWAALGPGIKRTYRDGRQRYHSAKKLPTPEHFHAWRKRVKDLLYQIGLLCPIWPEQMKAAEDELKLLGQRLGDDHDLYLLTERNTMKRFEKEAMQEAGVLKALVDERHRELRAQALALGARFYQEKPKVFCGRLGLYWKRWRRESKRLARTTSH